MEANLGSPDFTPQNELEVELVRAAHEPEFRDAFLRELIEGEIYLALLLAEGSRIEVGPGGQASVPAGARLEIGAVARGEHRALPFFSAPSRAQACYRQDHVSHPTRYATCSCAIRARASC